MSDRVVPSSAAETIRVLEELARREGPDAHAVRVHLAKLLLESSRAADAWSWCRGVLESDPGDIDALEIASRAFRALGDVARADRYLMVAETLARATEARAPLPTDDVVAPIVPLKVVATDTSSEGLERPTIKLHHVAGMQTVKRRLELSFLAPLQNPELRAAFGQSLRGGLLLWGPPGCGKTYLARAIAGELGAKFISVGLEDVLDMWIGNSEKNLHQLFETARRKAPCVLFFDEVDALGRKRGDLRHSPGRNVPVQFLSELDGVEHANEGVFVLAATNHPWDVDTALRRPGRLGRMLLVLPPDETARAAILRMNLASRPVDGVDVTEIARMTPRFSGADLVQVCESATELALERSLAAGHMSPIARADLRAALSEVKESTSAWLVMARNYAEFANDGGAYDDLLDYLRVRS